MALERIFAKRCLNPRGERGWALPSPAAIPAAAWGALRWLFTLRVAIYLFPAHRVIGDLGMLAKKLNITG